MNDKESKQDEPPFKIKIDKKHYDVDATEQTGRQLRDLVTPPIPETRDLFEEVAEGDDPLITDDAVVHLHKNQVFYTAPGRINPGV